MNHDLPYILGFSVFSGIGPVRFSLLYAYFGSAKAAWESSESELTNTGLSQSLVARFCSFRKKFSVEGYMDLLNKKKIRTITSFDREYPLRLKEIADPPFVLYCVGNSSISLLSEQNMIGVVGTRSVTEYGKAATKQIVAGLVDYGYIIVSGLAMGVDAVAHEETLRKKGRTIAVLGCGVDVIAPKSNASLYYRIREYAGLIISEMPPGLRPAKTLFPLRNRIISGLSCAVVVMEGAKDSGALITARYAAEQGREVFAVPGPITSIFSRGPAKLIKEGATLVESADDIIDQLGI
jgi:DNA processing protein